jgi:hypothetical protein
MRPRPPSHVEFATYVSGITPQAIKLSIPIGLIEAEPQMDELTWQAMRRANKLRYGTATQQPPVREASDPVPRAARASDSTPPIVSSDIDLVITTTRRIESLLEKYFGAIGKGLHEKLSSVETSVLPELVKRIRFIASLRNKMLHEEHVFVERDAFVATAQYLEHYFSNLPPVAIHPATKRPDTEPVKTEPKKAEPKQSTFYDPDH